MAVIDVDLFDSGYSVDDWLELEHSESHQRYINRMRGEMALDEENRAFFASLDRPVRLLMISQECGTDCETVAALKTIMDETGTIADIRIFAKKDVPDLMQRYLKEGRYESVPVIVALSPEMEEVAVMYEAPRRHDDWIQQSRKAIFRELGFPPDETMLEQIPLEEQRRWIYQYRDYYRENMADIHKQHFDEIRRLAQAALDSERVPVRRATGNRA